MRAESKNQTFLIRRFYFLLNISLKNLCFVQSDKNSKFNGINIKWKEALSCGMLLEIIL